MNPVKDNKFLIPFVVACVVLIFSIVFGVWAFMGRQDYKNNVDQKIDEAVEVAEDNLSVKKDAEFVEAYKSPFALYKGPAAFGTLAITYPRTWSNYVEESTGGTAVDGYMHPGYVPANTTDTNLALRYQVIERQYEQEIKSVDARVKQGRAKVVAYRAPKQESVLGIKTEGEIDGRKQGVMVLLPLRDKTIKIWTEGNEFRNDFENILKELTFVP